MKKIISMITFLTVLSAIIFPVNAQYSKEEEVLLKSNNVNIFESKKLLDKAILSAESNFKDIKKNQWFTPAVSKLYALGGVRGYEDGTFKPSKPISVAEFIAMLFASSGHKQDAGKQVWYKNYYTKAIELGVIAVNDTYNFNEKIKRHDMAKMVVRFAKVKGFEKQQEIFNDVNDLDSSFINTAYNEYLIRGYFNNGIRKFKPYGKANRAEAVAMTINILEYLDNIDEYKKKQENYFSKIEIIKEDQKPTEVKNSDFSTAIIRTGTEDNGGKAIQGKEYFAIIEYGADYTNNMYGNPEITFNIENNINITEVMDLSKDTLERWRNLPVYKEHILENKSENIDEIDWVHNTTNASNLSGFWQNTNKTKIEKLSETKTFINSIGGKKVYSFINEKGDIGKRYTIVKWKQNTVKPIKMFTKINLNDSFKNVLPEENLEDNADYAIIQVVPQSGQSNENKYELDYDEIDREFIYNINDDKPIHVELEKPESTIESVYKWGVNPTEGKLRVNIKSESPIKNLKIYDGGDITPWEKNKSEISRYPSIYWLGERRQIGDDPANKKFLENLINGQYSFNVNTVGSYGKRYYDVFNSSENAEGLKYIESKKVVERFAPIFKNDKEINVIVKNYNGIELPLQEITQGESNNNIYRNKKIQWEGTQYEIPVQRAMKKTAIDGSIKEVVAIDGKFDRVFQHMDSANVEYGIELSFESHFSEYATDLENDENTSGKLEEETDKNTSFNYAAFIPNSEELKYKIKPGSLFIPRGIYSAKVRTEIYKRLGEETEHNKIVQSVVNSFNISNRLPLKDKYENNVNIIPLTYQTNYYKVSDKLLKYDLVPLETEKYYSNEESTLLENTDPLFKQMLEGWSFCQNDVGRKSWDKYNYREYVKKADIRKVVEETIVTFEINPNYLEKNLSFKISDDTKDSDYKLKVYFSIFDNGVPNNTVRTEGSLFLDEIKINVRK